MNIQWVKKEHIPYQSGYFRKPASDSAKYNTANVLLDWNTAKTKCTGINLLYWPWYNLQQLKHFWSQGLHQFHPSHKGVLACNDEEQIPKKPTRKRKYQIILNYSLVPYFHTSTLNFCRWVSNHDKTSLGGVSNFQPQTTVILGSN